MLKAQHRTKSMPSLLKGLPPFRANPREAAPSSYTSEGCSQTLCGKALKKLRDLCADRELERPMDFCELPYRAHSLELSFESVEDLDPLTMDRLAIVGSHIYTDGSRIEGKVRAALTE
ncbi:hypothetical protein EVAR_87809_1 [Eumeta japonica]|uniref:Uncharacterized protein n=1 Tax=Eumeta variegata TaxID=151549 RepID=A0A4C1Z5X3_EUMVA|nr:hypothetical protein EVAR_87809_1 [Eumeta japonica]